MGFKTHDGNIVGKTQLFVEGDNGEAVPVKLSNLGGGGGGMPGEGSITTEMFAPDAKVPKAVVSDSTDSVTWAKVTGKPATFPAAAHTHTIANITGLEAALSAKLTASKATAQPDSTAADVATLVEDFNALLTKLRASGILSS